jgi:hypothetical protein
MLELKLPRQYCYECCRIGWESSWRSISNIIGSLIIGLGGTYFGTIHFRSGPTHDAQSINGIISFVIYVIAAWVMLFIVPALFVAPYRIWKAHKEQIKELEKVGTDDLERMLGGKYLYGGATFLYQGGDFGRVCRNFQCKADIEPLRDVFTAIPVSAPKGSMAHVNFRFHNSRQDTSARCKFHLMKDGRSVEIENIYEQQFIGVEIDGCFQLKMTWSDNYKLEDRASLLITVNGWTK